MVKCYIAAAAQSTIGSYYFSPELLVAGQVNDASGHIHSFYYYHHHYYYFYLFIILQPYARKRVGD
jgi:hypothetical protein